MSHATPLHHRGSLADSMPIMTASALPGHVYDAVYEQVHKRVVSSVTWTLEHALQEEVRHSLGCERYERRLLPRRPEATRSGTYPRELWTQYGGIFDLCVPRRRRGNRDLHGPSLARYARCWGPFLDQQLLHDALGHSLRDLQEAMHLTLGEMLGLDACNRRVLGLAERAQACKTSRLETPPPLVRVDGLWRKLAGPTGDITRDAVRRTRPVKPKAKRVMLTALGIWEDGHWEILTWQLAPGEDAGSWGTLLGTLYTKGSTEETTHLIVSDGGQGLEKALYRHLWGVPPQRGIFPKIKNIAAHLQ